MEMEVAHVASSGTPVVGSDVCRLIGFSFAYVCRLVSQMFVWTCVHFL